MLTLENYVLLVRSSRLTGHPVFLFAESGSWSGAPCVLKECGLRQLCEGVDSDPDQKPGGGRGAFFLQ